MIALLQTEPEHRSAAASPRLVVARAVVAAILLPNMEPSAPPIAAWKAWMFVAWVGLVTITYAIFMSGMTSTISAG